MTIDLNLTSWSTHELSGSGEPNFDDCWLQSTITHTDFISEFRLSTELCCQAMWLHDYIDYM